MKINTPEILTGSDIRFKCVDGISHFIVACSVGAAVRERGVGKPINVKGLSEYVDDAGFATVVGLLQYGKVQSDNKKSSTQKTGESLFHRVQSWFKGEF